LRIARPAGLPPGAPLKTRGYLIADTGAPSFVVFDAALPLDGAFMRAAVASDGVAAFVREK